MNFRKQTRPTEELKMQNIKTMGKHTCGVGISVGSRSGDGPCQSFFSSL